jgi:hypothetical protein
MEKSLFSGVSTNAHGTMQTKGQQLFCRFPSQGAVICFKGVCTFFSCFIQQTGVVRDEKNSLVFTLFCLCWADRLCHVGQLEGNTRSRRV